MSLPCVALLGLSVGVTVVVRQRHVLQPVVLGRGWRGVGQAVGRRVAGGQAVGRRVRWQGSPAGAETLARAHSARPLGQVLRVQTVTVQPAVFGPEEEMERRRFSG